MYFKNLLNVSCSAFDQDGKIGHSLATPFDRNLADSLLVLCRASGRSQSPCFRYGSPLPQVQNTALRNYFSSTGLEGVCF